jgi:fatty acid desaturase
MDDLGADFARQAAPARARRDYSLLGPDAQRAVENGLKAAEWYHTDIPRKEMKALMQRADQPAIRDTLLWIGSMVVFAGIATLLWTGGHPWLSVPFWLAFGVLYGSASDSRWHECGHGTAFKTPWMNDVVYQIACFMIIRNPYGWKWSHTRHHTDTIIVGLDPEIGLMRPPHLFKLLLNAFGLVDIWNGLGRMFYNASGRIHPEEATYIPESEWPKVIRAARVWLAIYALTLALALWTWSILPFLVILGPRVYGSWHAVMCGVLQHGGLADNVLDHRLNSRTVYMNPVSRFIYWNMNYHIEHHMFPMVPYHQLPALHARIKDDLPPPNRSIADGFREMWPALVRQLRYEDYFLKRELPPTAKPYREDFHAGALGA